MNYNDEDYDLYLFNETNPKYKPIWTRLYGILTKNDHEILEGLEKYKDLESNEKFEKIASDIGHSTVYFEKYNNRYTQQFKIQPLYGDLDGSVAEILINYHMKEELSLCIGCWPLFCIEKYLSWIKKIICN